MIPGLDLIAYEDDPDPDSQQSLILTPLGSVAWDGSTGDVWDANYNTDEAAFEQLASQFEEGP